MQDIELDTGRRFIADAAAPAMAYDPRYSRADWLPSERWPGDAAQDVETYPFGL